MAAGTTIQHKRKAGAFTNGQLAAGEFGVDTTNGVVYFSTDGGDILSLGGANSLYAERSYFSGGTLGQGVLPFMVARTAMTITRIDSEVNATPNNPPTFFIYKNGAALSSVITIDGGPNSYGNRYKSTAVSLSVAAGDRIELYVDDTGEYIGVDPSEGPLIIGLEFTRA